MQTQKDKDRPAEFFTSAIDIWSVGIIMAQMVLGWDYFSGDKGEDDEKNRYVYHGVIRALEPKIKGSSLYNVIRAMLVLDPKVRPTASQLRKFRFFTPS